MSALKPVDFVVRNTILSILNQTVKESRKMHDSLKKKTITRFLIYSSILLAVDGSWGNWENWSVCTVTCGGGVRLRSRQCDNPAPLRGGVDCIGFAQEAGDCNAEECIGKSKTCVCYP